MADPCTVLVVDDEPPIRVLLMRWLTKWDYTVKEAGTAMEAIAAMEAEPARVVVCDIGMPEHDGLWLAEQVLGRWPDTAVVMATGRDDSPTVHSSRKVGAVAYVTKPFDPDLLRQAVDHASGRLKFRPSAE